METFTKKRKAKLSDAGTWGWDDKGWYYSDDCGLASEPPILINRTSTGANDSVGIAPIRTIPVYPPRSTSTSCRAECRNMNMTLTLNPDEGEVAMALKVEELMVARMISELELDGVIYSTDSELRSSREPQHADPGRAGLTRAYDNLTV